MSNLRRNTIEREASPRAYIRTLARLHPFVFVLASLLFFYLVADVIASPDQILRPLLILWLLLALLNWPARKLTGDGDWAALLLSVVVLGLFVAPDFFVLAATATAIAILPWLIYSLLRRRALKIMTLSALLSVVSLFLVGLFTYPTILGLSSLPATYFATVRLRGRPLLAQPVANNALPDIYYLVLDGYARADVLAEYFQYDNSEFLTFLRSRGFVIPANSHSNYPKTALSVTSTLNMDYIENLAPGIEDSSYWWLMSPLMDHSRTRAMLQTLGYRTVSITADWGVTDNPSADIYYRPAPIVLNDLEGALLDHSPLGALTPLVSKIAFGRTLEEHRQLARFQFETLADIPDVVGPKFVFVHIISPHPPFVFDAEGHPLDQGYGFTFSDGNDYPLSEQEYRAGYIGQLQFVNAELVSTINSILENSSIPPIILLQADHGSGMLTDFGSAENTCLHERFSNFAAYYLPGLDATAVPADITPVNLFRMIFNEYFGAELPLLENMQLYSEENVYIYRALDVTDEIETCSRR